MTIDTYAVCPCGSGKKIKFCKCKDSVHELDRVLKMVEGGQMVPALDRLAAILEEHPDAAWALAIRGRLLMDLREYQSLEENAQRFARLQPANPLALTQRSAAALFRQDLDAATDLLLEALTESGQTVDPFVLDVASLLSYALAGNGIVLTARVYATLALVSPGYEDSRLAANVLQQLNGDPKINVFAKVVPPLIERPSGADWGERYDEAASLLANNKVELAQNKFESLQRSAPLQPAIVSGLLNCAIWRSNDAAQVEYLKKLSECEDLPAEERARYLATSLVVSPDSNQAGVPMARLTGEYESVEESQLAMTAHERFADIPANALGSFKEESGITPRAGFQILDKPALASDTVVNAENVTLGVGLALLYGRQTDRAARIEVVGVSKHGEGDVQQLIETVAPGGTWTADTDHLLPLAEYATPHIAGIRQEQVKGVDFDALQTEVFQARVRETLLETPVALLGDVSLKEAAGDDSKQVAKIALLRHLEAEDNLTSRAPDLVRSLYQEAGLEPPAEIHVTNDQVEEVANYDLGRIDPSGLDAENLVFLIQRAMQVSASVAGRRASLALLAMDLPEEGQQVGAKMPAYAFMIQRAADNEEAVRYLEEAKSYCDQRSLPTASLLLTELMLRARRGEPEAFQKCAETLTQKYGNDQEVMGRFQQILVQLGLLRPDGSMPQMPPGGPGGPAGQPPAAAPASGLWTPDGGGGSAPPPSPGPAGNPAPASGGGKLWVPGMD